MFFLLKSFFKCPSLSENVIFGRHLHVTMLQYWAKFSSVLVQWSIRMIRAKNYNTVTKFVKVMHLCLEFCGLFFPGHGVDAAREFLFHDISCSFRRAITQIVNTSKVRFFKAFSNFALMSRFFLNDISLSLYCYSTLDRRQLKTRN